MIMRFAGIRSEKTISDQAEKNCQGIRPEKNCQGIRPEKSYQGLDRVLFGKPGDINNRKKALPFLTSHYALHVDFALMIVII
jgi:hypothetical protein